MVTDKELDEGRLYPPLKNIRDVSLQIAVQLADHAYKTGEYCRRARLQDGWVLPASTPLRRVSIYCRRARLQDG